MADVLRVLFDINVWVSSLLHAESVPGRAIDLARVGRVRSLLSEPLLEQARGALPRLGYAPPEVDEAVVDMLAVSELVFPAITLAVVTAKESDNRVLECAVAGGADVIVTGDRKHLLPLGAYAGIPIVSPADFVRSFAR